MNKFKKISAVIGGVVVVLIVALVILAKVVITPERVMETVLPIAEKTLERKLELADVSVSIFSGIELQGLKVYEADGKALFVSTDLVRLKYQLLPLLAMKVVVDEVTVERPMINVTRLADGSFSFDDILGGEDKVDKMSAAESSSGSTSISLLVSTVNVTDGVLKFTDYQVNPKSPFRSEINALQVTAKGITLTGSVPVSLSCNINDSTLKVDGSISLAGPTVDLKVKLDGMDAVAYSPYFKDAVPGKLAGLQLALDARLSGGLDKVSATGSLKGSGLDLVLEALPEAPFMNVGVVFDYDLNVDLKEGLLEIRSSRVDFNGLVAEATGRINQLFETPVLDVKLSVPGLDIKQAIQSVPPSLVEAASELNPSGTVRFTAQLTGASDADPLSLLKNASLSLDNVQATGGGQRPALFGNLNLVEKNLVSEGLEMRLGDNKARIDLNASNLFGKTITVKADVSSDQFQLDPLLGAGAASGSVASESSASSSAEELGPFDLPLRARGTIKIKKTLYKGLSIDNFIARYTLQDNILTISQLDGNIAGGTFANTARVDLGVKGLAYSADLGVKALQADPLLTAFIPKAAGALLGAMNLDLNIKGKGTQWQTLSNNLTGQGDMLVSDGRIISPGLVKGFASFLQLSNTDEIRFQNFQGDIKIVDGKVQIDSSILSEEIKLYPKGTVGLDGTLKMSMDTRLSPQFAGRIDSRGKVTQYLTDDDGWSQVPLLVSGNYSSPRFGLDPKGVQKQATKVIGRELGRKLDKLFGGSKSADEQEQSNTEGQPAADPTNKLLQDSLKSLFGN